MQSRFRWRLMALAVLAIYAALILLLIRFLTQNFILSLALAGAGALLLCAAWLIVSARTRMRMIIGISLAAISVFGWLAALLFLIKGTAKSLLALGLGVLLALAYSWSVRILSDKYWRAKRDQAISRQAISRFKRPVLIINPKAGAGRAIKAGIDKKAADKGIKVYMTSVGDKVENVARRAVREGADVLGISGGDGSIGAVAKVALERDLPMVVLPGGTRCHFARDIGLEPRSITDALSSYTGIERKIDVADINGRIFLNNVSLGIYSDIVDHPDYRDHKMRVSLGVMRSIASGSKELYDLHFRHRRHRFKKAAEVLIGVNRYNTIDIFELGHRQRMDEGVLQVTAITRLDNTLVKKLLGVARVDTLDRQASEGAFLQWTTTSFSIDSAAKTMVAGVDGEREVYHSPISIRIHPKALKLFVPAEGVRGRALNPLDPAAPRRIWQTAMRK